VREGRWSDNWSDRRKRDDRSDAGPGERERSQTTPAPPLSDAIVASALDPAARRDLLGLQKDVAESVARHLVAAGTLVDEDPEAALAHARYARRRASRIAVVREAAGITAYHAGEWAEALAELRAARRMGGGPGHLAVMADVERAMGRPERAIELSRSPEARELGRSEQIELAIVTAGARRDLGELDAAVLALQVPELEASRRDPWSARLFYAYADNLLAAGRESDALQWFVHAADADTDGETDADARVAELTGEPLADDGIEFGLDDEYPGDAPTDRPTPDATEDAAEKAEHADSTAGDATVAVTADAATSAAGDNPVRDAVDAPTHAADELAGQVVDDPTGTPTANAEDHSGDDVAAPVRAPGDTADPLDDSAAVGRRDATAESETPAPEREVGIPSQAAVEPAGVDAATSTRAEDERAASEEGAIAVPTPDTTEPAAHDTAGGAAVGGVADATHRPISGSVDDAADGGALDQAPGKAEDQPRSAPTNGHTDAADSDSASTNGSGYADPAVVAARGEADPR
jgi:tetratricopeptide (TPR) repeat protein